MVFVKGSAKKNTILKRMQHSLSSITSILTSISQDFLQSLHANAGIVPSSFNHTCPAILHYITYSKNIINQNVSNRILTLSHFYYNH
jgi:hypothetical protein